MRHMGWAIANFFLFLLLALILTSMQTSLWTLILGYFPSPHLWLTILVFWTLYRPLPEAFMMTYALSFSVVPLTAMPTAWFLGINLLLFALTHGFRQRIYWPGPSYFMVVSASLAGLVPIIYFFGTLASASFVPEFLFYEWILRSLLTALVAPPLFHFYHWVDRLTKKEIPREAGGGYL